MHKIIKVPAQQRGVGVGFGVGFGQGFDAGFGVGFGHGLGVMGSNCVTFTELEMFKKKVTSSPENSMPTSVATCAAGYIPTKHLLNLSFRSVSRLNCDPAFNCMKSFPHLSIFAQFTS